MHKFLIPALSCAFLLSACQEESGKNIQDSKAAVAFFTHELEFKSSPHGVKRAIKENSQNITIVDVRARKDFEKGHIPGAINIPYHDHKSFDGDEKEFKGLRKDGYNYIYCYEMLCNLGAKAAKKFGSLGYPVKEVVGGFKTWKDDDLPIEK